MRSILNLINTIWIIITDYPNGISSEVPQRIAFKIRSCLRFAITRGLASIT